MKKIKIGMVSRYPPQKDGIGIYTLDLVNQLKKHTKIITIGTLNSDADYIVDFNSFSLKKDLQKIIKKEKLDLLHFQYIPPFYSKFLNFNFLSALKQTIPTVVTFHEVYYVAKNFKEKILSLIQKLIISKSNKIVVHTPNQKKFLQRNNNSNKITNILMGFNPQNIKRKKGKTLLFFGIISPKKGLKYLINAMKFLPDYKLIIRGNPINNEVKKELKLIIKNSNAIIDYKFGWISEEEKQEVYKKSNIVVLPYTWGPYQSAIVTDAISQRLPVIVSNVGAISEITKLYNTGQVVKPKKPKEIAKATKQILTNYNTYLKNIDNYQKKANWEKIAQIHYNTYLEILN